MVIRILSKFVLQIPSYLGRLLEQRQEAHYIGCQKEEERLDGLIESLCINWCNESDTFYPPPPYLRWFIFLTKFFIIIGVHDWTEKYTRISWIHLNKRSISIQDSIQGSSKILSPDTNQCYSIQSLYEKEQA